MKFYPEGSIAWRRATGDTEGASSASFSGSPSFVLDGVSLDEDVFVIDAAAKYDYSSNIKLGIGLSGVLGDKSRGGALTLRLDAKF